MKKIYLLLLLISSVYVNGQNSTEKTSKQDSIYLSYLRMNFAVPDLPAFSILGNQPSDLLRPSSVNELSIITTQFYKNNSITLPQTLSIEIDPGLLIQHNKITLRNYQRNQFLYSIRLSAGSQRNDKNAYNLAIGLRGTIIDKGSLVNDKGFQESVHKMALRWFKSDDSIEIISLKKLNATFNTHYGRRDLPFNSADTIKVPKAYQTFYNKTKSDLELWSLFSDSLIDIKLKELKKIQKQDHWNALKWDIAVAWLSSSPDSLAKNIKTKRVAAWTTLAVPFWKWGQLLIGVNYTHQWNDTVIDSVRVKENFGNLAIPLRLYAGKNRLKGFVEVQYKWNGETSHQDGLLNLGAEINPLSGVWLLFNAGYLLNNVFSKQYTSSLFTHFDIRFTIPESFNLQK